MLHTVTSSSSGLAWSWNVSGVPQRLQNVRWARREDAMRAGVPATNAKSLARTLAQVTNGAAERRRQIEQ
jgi:hypothetical protein